MVYFVRGRVTGAIKIGVVKGRAQLEIRLATWSEEKEELLRLVFRERRREEDAA